MPGIGFLSSLQFTGTPLAQAFDRGLGMAGVYRNTQDRLGYDAARYSSALATLNGDGQVTLIAAAGGIVSELPATAQPQKDTISLVGGTIAGSVNPGGRFRRRLSLESVASNPQRIAHLARTFHIQPNQICLLANPNSKMAASERGPFATVRSADIKATSTPAEITSQYTNAFANLSTRAVIVSADPWFFQTGSELVRIANQWVTADPARRVCYPLQEYEGHGPARNQTTLCGPSILQAYEFLGQLAAHVIDPSKPSPGNPPQVCRDI
jgi:hypothetical protein